jgi:hypothetical protein
MRRVHYDDTINSIAAVYTASNIFTLKSGYDFIFVSAGTSCTLVKSVIKTIFRLLNMINIHK